MIEAMLLTMAIGFVIMLLKSVSRFDENNSENPLGLFSYKELRTDEVVKSSRKVQRHA